MFQFLPGIALSQVRESVEDKIISSVANTIPVFMTNDLRRQYQEVLRNLDASEKIINHANVARLKEEEILRGTRMAQVKEWLIYIINIRRKCLKSIA